MRLGLASLEAVLASRDARLAAQLELGGRQGWPLLSLTLVSPGPLKDDARRRAFMDLAEQRFALALEAAGLPVLERQRLDGLTGPESLWAVKASALALKALAAAIEEVLPAGRLLDADVLVAPKALAEGTSAAGLPEPVPRSALGLAPRPCLVCGEDLRACMAGRVHTPAELAEAVDRLLGLGLG